jgi:GMC oxidoreductase
MSEASILKSVDADAREVEENQIWLRGSLQSACDFILCESGSSGAIVVRRLIENPDVSMLLIEADGSDGAPEMEMAAARPMNLGSARLEVHSVAQPAPQRARHPEEHGQSAGRRVMMMRRRNRLSTPLQFSAFVPE